MFKKFKNFNRGEMSFGVEIVLFLVALFILWALFSKPSENVNKPFIKDPALNTTQQ